MSSLNQIPPIPLVFGAVHLPPALTVPFVCGLAVLGIWYWRRMGRGSIPPIRRRLRRIGLLLGAFGLVLITAAISFLDPAVHRLAYLLAWLGVLFVVLIAVVVATIDAAMTIRLHQKSVERQLVRDALRLRGAVDERRGDSKSDSTLSGQ